MSIRGPGVENLGHEKVHLLRENVKDQVGNAADELRARRFPPALSARCRHCISSPAGHLSPSADLSPQRTERVGEHGRFGFAAFTMLDSTYSGPGFDGGATLRPQYARQPTTAER